MFIFGTNDFGEVRCNIEGKPIGCSCICETAASEDGTCNTKQHNGFNVYRYLKGISNWSKCQITLNINLHIVILRYILKEVYLNVQ